MRFDLSLAILFLIGCLQSYAQSPPVQVMIDAKFFGIPKSTLALILPAGQSRHSDASWSLPEKQVVTSEQRAQLLKALQTRADVKLLAQQKITTLNKRQAEVVVENGENLTPSEAFNPKASYFLTAVPFVHEDGFTISMTLIPGYKRYIGWETNPRFSTDASGGMPPIGRIEALITAPQPVGAPAAEVPVQQQQSFAVHSQTPIPVYETRRFATNAIVWDGQTAILAFEEKARIPASIETLQLPIVKRTATVPTDDYAVVVFVTPTLISPDGDPLHNPADMPFAGSAVPPQRAR